MRPRWLLDTCVVSEQVRPHPDHKVQSWLKDHLPECAFAAVTFGEISYGIEILAHGKRRNTLVSWAENLRAQAAGRTLPTDSEVWIAFGRLKASLRAIGRLQDTMDMLIAATAIANGLTVVTRNISHFQDTGVPLLNPWIEHA